MKYILSLSQENVELNCMVLNFNAIQISTDIKCRINFSFKEDNYEVLKTSLNTWFEAIPVLLQEINLTATWTSLMLCQVQQFADPFLTAFCFHHLICMSWLTCLSGHKVVFNDLFRLIAINMQISVFSRIRIISAVLYESRSSMRWSREDDASLLSIDNFTKSPLQVKYKR